MTRLLVVSEGMEAGEIELEERLARDQPEISPRARLAPQARDETDLGFAFPGRSTDETAVGDVCYKSLLLLGPGMPLV